MASKKELDDLLGSGSPPQKPVIRRGQGLKLSTDGQTEEIPATEEKQPASSRTQPASENNTIDLTLQPPIEETITSLSPQPSPETSTATKPASTESQKRTKAKSQNRTSAKSQKSSANLPVRLKRVNRGYKLREDLIKACKRIALEEDRKLYEVMEEALATYVAKKGY